MMQMRLGRVVLSWGWSRDGKGEKRVFFPFAGETGPPLVKGSLSLVGQDGFHSSAFGLRGEGMTSCFSLNSDSRLIIRLRIFRDR